MRRENWGGAGSNQPAATNELGQPTATSEVRPAGSTTNSVPENLGALDKDTLQTATGWLAGVAPKAGSWLLGQFGRVASWFGVIAGLALIPVYTFYFLLEKESISSRWTSYLPVSDSHFKDELIFILNSVNNYLIAFFRGQVLVAICDGILYGFGFLLIGLPYALLIGVMAVFLTMIPFLGAITTCISALLIAIVQFGDCLSPGPAGVRLCPISRRPGHLPKIMGGRVGLHPVTSSSR